MKVEKKQIIQTVSHPVEEFLNLPPSSTINIETERETTLVKSEQYDEKDRELEDTYQEVYDVSMTGYENLLDEMDATDPKYISRMAEVATQYLNTALKAAELKGKLKEHKDKLIKKTQPKNVTNNNTMILSRESLLETLRDKNKISIDVEHIEIKKTEE